MLGDQMETVAVRVPGKSYLAAVAVVDTPGCLDLTIRQGECVILLDQSGSGKPQLLRVIAGLVEGYDGELAFQDHRLFPSLTVLENVRIALNNTPLSGREKTDQALSYLALVGLEGFEQVYPGQLSDGMAQRVVLARALVSRPRVLLLDQPFATLDAITRVHVQSVLARVWHRENITMVFVTRDVDEAIYLGDRVVVMGSAPDRIRAQLTVEIERPRLRTDPAFRNLKDRILGVLEQDRDMTWPAPQSRPVKEVA